MRHREWPLHGWLTLARSVGSGSVPPVRAGSKQSSEQPDSSSATRGQLYLIWLPLGPALVSKTNVGLVADTVSTPADVDRLPRCIAFTCRLLADMQTPGQTDRMGRPLPGLGPKGVGNFVGKTCPRLAGRDPKLATLIERQAGRLTLGSRAVPHCRLATLF